MPYLPEGQIRAHGPLYRSLFETSDNLVLTFGPDGMVTSWNAALERLTGPRAVPFPMSEILPVAACAAVRERLDGGTLEERLEVEVLTAGGTHAPIDLVLSSFSLDERTSGLLAVGRDKTVERAAERMDLARRSIVDMLALDAPLDRILERLTDLVDGYFPDAVSAVSRRSEGKLEYVAGRLPERVQRSFAGLRIAPMRASCGTAAYLQRPVVASSIATDPTWTTLGSAALSEGFQACWSAPIIGGSGAVLGTFAIYFRRPIEATHDRLELLKSAADVVAGTIQHHAHANEMYHRATHDPVTQLPNRYALEEQLRKLIVADPGRKCALLCLGVDSFKLVNQTFGHRLSDEFLRQVSARLLAGLAAPDSLYRIGEDKFVIVLLAEDLLGRAREVAAEALQSLSVPVMAEGREMFAGASVGISVYPGDGRDPETLVANAAIALAQGKTEGRRGVSVFAPAMLTQISKRLEMRNDLHRALRREEFSLHYQPQYNLKTGRLVGQEALLRWNSRRGAVAPADFIPIAEESGLIVPIGEWALRQACDYAAAQNLSGGRSVRCAVNISAIQLAQADFIDRVSEILEVSGLPAELLDLELTETALMRDLPTAAERILQLRLMGITISVDDFGMGYSSLSRLQQLPLDSLKIDLSFVREIRNAIEIPPIVQAIVALGRGLGINVIAEGVESHEQLRVLQLIGCNEGQGFLLGRPAPPEDRVAMPDRLWFLPESGDLRPGGPIHYASPD